MSEAAEAAPAGRLPRAGPLILTVEESDSTLLLRMAGDLDLACIGQVTAALDRLEVDRTTLLVFDLRELAFLDAAGLRTILHANDYCNDHHIRCTVLKPRGFASRVFTLTRVHLELDLVDSAARGHGAIDARSAHGPWRPTRRKLLTSRARLGWPELARRAHGPPVRPL